MRYLYFFAFLLFCCSFALESYGQIVPDTALTDPIPAVAEQKADTSVNGDSLVLATAKPPLSFQPVPKRAGLFSAIVPGTGQLYNRQYWKLPIVYVGVGAVAYFFQDNLKLYQSYRKEYLQRVQNPDNITNYTNYNTDQLRQLQENYRQNLDMTVLFGAVFYAAQILDAVAAAHLKNFDVSKDISMNVRPVASPNGLGLGLVMNFK